VGPPSKPEKIIVDVFEDGEIAFIDKKFSSVVLVAGAR